MVEILDKAKKEKRKKDIICNMSIPAQKIYIFLMFLYYVLRIFKFSVSMNSVYKNKGTFLLLLLITSTGFPL